MGGDHRGVAEAQRRPAFYNDSYRRLWDLERAFLDGNPDDSSVLDKLRVARKIPEQPDFRAWKNKLFEAYRAIEPAKDMWYLPDGRALSVVTTPNPEGGVTYLFDDVTESLKLARQNDGLLRVQPVPPEINHFASAIVTRLKIMSRLNIAEKRRPQDGRISLRVANRPVDVRVSTIPCGHGERVVLRLLDKQAGRLRLEQIGMDAPTTARLDELIHRPHGIFLVTGPTGSGKTTTLYSALRQLARPEINVCTIEDPIEMVEPAFNQMQVQPAIDLDFAGGVRTLLRQDPDIIMVGEIRDRETAEVAIQAALTGHLVLSTLHTNDAPSAVTRLMDLGVEPYLIGATLLGVVAQRLVRTLCPHCRAPVPCDLDAWQSLVGRATVNPPRTTSVGRGCDECRQTGFRGREGIYEILTVGSSINELIRPGCHTGELRRAALANGMRPLRLAGALKVATGRTTFTEVMSVVPPANADD